jgi:uncharacterized protein YjbJ (UPF0337 family)
MEGREGLMRIARAALAGLACLALLAPAATSAQAQAPVQAPQSATRQVPASAKEPLRKVAWDKIAGNWKRFKGSVKQRWGRLTNNEIQQAQGRREALNGFIQARYGIDREAANRQIDEWLKSQKTK